MTRRQTRPSTPVVPAPAERLVWLVGAALVGLGFSTASAWVHYRLIEDPTYASICDVSRTFSCSNAYTSQYGAVAGVPVAVIGVVFFAFVLGLVALCARSAPARASLPGYVFAVSTAALAATLYLAYASVAVLQSICLLCVGTYAAVVTLFVVSGSAARFPLTELPARAGRDLGQLVRTPAALAAAAAFVAAASAALVLFPQQPVSAAAGETAPAVEAGQVPTATASQIQQIEQFLQQQPRVPVVAAAGDAVVLILKFNDYMCPPCRMTYLDYKPVLAKYEKLHPGKVRLETRDFPLDPECNRFAPGGTHLASCEAAVAVRLAREKGKAEQLEEWLFANQPTLTPQTVRDAARMIAGVTDMDARYASVIELVRGDIAQAGQLQVQGTPTFFMNGIRLPGLRAEFFDAAIAWELRRLGVE
ncbi:MAG: vitamin K epoxide reductase family protein [Acidobacteriota bacterium]